MGSLNVVYNEKKADALYALHVPAAGLFHIALCIIISLLTLSIRNTNYLCLHRYISVYIVFISVYIVH